MTAATGARKRSTHLLLHSAGLAGVQRRALLLQRRLLGQLVALHGSSVPCRCVAGQLQPASALQDTSAMTQGCCRVAVQPLAHLPASL